MRADVAAVAFEDTEQATDITVAKSWANADGTSTWPTGVEVEIQLTADGEAVEDATATLSSTQTSYVGSSRFGMMKREKTVKARSWQ